MSRKSSLFAVLAAVVLVLSVVGPAAAAGVTTATYADHQPNHDPGEDDGDDADDGDDNDNGPNVDAFGQKVKDKVQTLLSDRDSGDKGIGSLVADFVTSNNPGADNRPDHAGPPEWVFDGGDHPGPDNPGPPSDGSGNDGDSGPEVGDPPETPNDGPIIMNETDDEQ